MFFLTKTVEIRWNWRSQIFSLKIRQCKILDKFLVWKRAAVSWNCQPKKALVGWTLNSFLVLKVGMNYEQWKTALSPILITSLFMYIWSQCYMCRYKQEILHIPVLHWTEFGFLFGQYLTNLLWTKLCPFVGETPFRTNSAAGGRSPTWVLFLRLVFVLCVREVCQ